MTITLQKLMKYKNKYQMELLDENEMQDELAKIMAEAEIELEGNKNKTLAYIKNKVPKELYDDILEYIEDSGWVTDFSIIDTPIGTSQEEDFEFLKEVYVDQTTNGGFTGDEFAGTICIKIADKEYLKFHYEM